MLLELDNILEFLRLHSNKNLKGKLNNEAKSFCPIALLSSKYKLVE